MFYGETYQRAAFRIFDDPTSHEYITGFRCARQSSTAATDQPPVAVINYHTIQHPPPSDYPYDSSTPASPPPFLGGTIYLSSHNSYDPDGLGVETFWEVTAPDQSNVALHQIDTSSENAFTADEAGQYWVHLQVTESGAGGQVANEYLPIVVASGCFSGVKSNLTLGAEGPSCAGGLDCGGVSCCQNTLVDGGTFPMGRSTDGCDGYPCFDADCEADQPEHDATVSDFNLDTFEVTVGRFRKFMQQYDGTPPAQGSGAHPHIPGSGWQAAWDTELYATQAEWLGHLNNPSSTWTDAPGANENYPITSMNWYEAFAFCAWDGGRLPTEAEWEYAAAGGSENRLYPWGRQDPDPTLVNYYFSENSPFADVGSHPAGAGPWGHEDLAGSMMEWCLDGYDEDWYSGGGATCDNCANLNATSTRSRRGSDWGSIWLYMGSTRRWDRQPQVRGGGFRCARIGVGAEAPPVPVIKFNLEPPTSSSDYPYDATFSPPLPPIKGSKIYISGAESYHPDGESIETLWYVTAPDGSDVVLDQMESFPENSFMADLAGTYNLRLEVRETAPGGLVANAYLDVAVTCLYGVESNLTHGTEGPSCAGGLDCDGASCCRNTLVVGGTFSMGRAADGCDAHTCTDSWCDGEQPEHEVVVADFYLDMFEVTVGRFRKFVEQYDGSPPSAGAGAHPLIAGSGWQSAWNSELPMIQAALSYKLKCDSGFETWTDAPGANENQAVNCVTWYEAFAFCAWDGGRLPTEAEWEYASAGGSDNRLYSWGLQAPDGTLANYQGSYALPSIDVGSFAAGAGRWGHLDLTGGSQEWTLDWYDESWYGGGGALCSNCANLNIALHRVARGGSWVVDETHLPSTRRDHRGPERREPYIGFRCAKML